MTFEEFATASPELLRAQAKACFDQANASPSWGGAPTLLLTAQFYLQELDRRQANRDRQDTTLERRHDQRIAWRDLFLEIIVILLIGGEIALAIKQGRDEDQLMDKQNAILTRLQESSADTARTMQRVVDTTTSMSTATELQLGLQYKVDLAIAYDPSTKHIDLQNNGRTAITLTGTQLSRQSLHMLPQPHLIAGNGGRYSIPADTFVAELTDKVPFGTTATIPFSVYVHSQLGTPYVIRAEFAATNDQRGLTILTHTLANQGNQAPPSTTPQKQ